jgi:flagellar biogenesis protein FliO
VKNSLFHRSVWLPLLLAVSSLANADEVTNTLASAATAAPAAPSITLSLLRVIGALALVLGIFLGGVWLFRNWQRLAIRNGAAPKLNILEVRSLGQRHAIYVVGYEQQRMLLASSPTGVTMLTHLPESDLDEPTPQQPAFSFADSLRHVLERK